MSVIEFWKFSDKIFSSIFLLTSFLFFLYFHCLYIWLLKFFHKSLRIYLFILFNLFSFLSFRVYNFDWSSLTSPPVILILLLRQSSEFTFRYYIFNSKIYIWLFLISYMFLLWLSVISFILSTCAFIPLSIVKIAVLKSLSYNFQHFYYLWVDIILGRWRGLTSFDFLFLWGYVPFSWFSLY